MFKLFELFKKKEILPCKDCYVQNENECAAKINKQQLSNILVPLAKEKEKMNRNIDKVEKLEFKLSIYNALVMEILKEKKHIVLFARYCGDGSDNVNFIGHQDIDSYKKADRNKKATLAMKVLRNIISPQDIFYYPNTLERAYNHQYELHINNIGTKKKYESKIKILIEKTESELEKLSVESLKIKEEAKPFQDRVNNLIKFDNPLYREKSLCRKIFYK